TRFLYDGDGGRVQLITPTTTTTTIGSLYEVLPGGTTRTHIFFGPTRLATLERTPLLLAKGTVPCRAYASLRRFFRAVEETFVGKAYASTTLPPGVSLKFYHGDHLGSVNLITDHTGQQVRLNEFSPFGSLTRGEGTVDAPQKFTGKRLDDSTGLYYFGARYYDPQLGRFIQPDTIVQAPSDPQTLNRYTYCRNNPLIYTDPTGHSFWRSVGRFFRQWVAPVAAAVVAIVVFAAVSSVAGPVAGSLAASMAYSATYNGISTFGANLERGRGFFESYGRGMLAYAATAVGGPIGGGAASAALVGGDPGRGALLGTVQAGFAVVGAFIPAPPFPGNVLTNAAMAAGQGATGAAIVGGDPGQGAWRSAASAAAATVAMAIANGDFQRAVDGGQKGGRAEGRMLASAEAMRQDRTLSAYAERNQRQGGHVVGAIRGPNGESIPMVDYGSGRAQVGFDNYVDPLSAALNPMVRTAGTVGGDVVLDTALQLLGIPTPVRTAISVIKDVVTHTETAE
ncbi:MAG: RHS repeat-associated core domain-containing protein, partial [Elusimicrobia bacterium]|nr:RHS repeat-associated core domain-containing protein [Elusimicrobiota bacterium]